jgi:hypothetical protein
MHAISLPTQQQQFAAIAITTTTEKITNYTQRRKNTIIIQFRGSSEGENNHVRYVVSINARNY